MYDQPKLCMNLNSFHQNLNPLHMWQLSLSIHIYMLFVFFSLLSVVSLPGASRCRAWVFGDLVGNRVTVLWSLVKEPMLFGSQWRLVAGQEASVRKAVLFYLQMLIVLFAPWQQPSNDGATTWNTLTTSQQPAWPCPILTDLNGCKVVLRWLLWWHEWHCSGQGSRHIQNFFRNLLVLLDAPRCLSTASPGLPSFSFTARSPSTFSTNL